MNTREADALGNSIADSLAAGNVAAAHAALQPVLEQRTPFRLLDRIAAAVGPVHRPQTGAFLERIAAGGSEGGWVIIGGLLRQEYAAQSAVVFAQCRRYIVAADTWYGADILGERVPGPALVEDLVLALELLAPWRSDANRWVRRSVGVAVHFWAKRSRGNPALEGQAGTLLDFLEPMFGEWEMDVVKGVGWGLKTLGKYYPGQLTNWLLLQKDRPYRRLMVRKALTYLTDGQRDQVMGAFGL